MISIIIDGSVDGVQPIDPQDPVLAMLGVGRHLWQMESGDRFIQRLRFEDSPTPLPADGSTPSPANLSAVVWERVRELRGGQFHTVTRLPFTFEVEANGIWFFRDGKRINRKLTRAQFEIAVSRCPLKNTTGIKDLIDYPYLFAMLMDRRVRGDAW